MRYMLRTDISKRHREEKIYMAEQLDTYKVFNSLETKTYGAVIKKKKKKSIILRVYKN